MTKLPRPIELTCLALGGIIVLASLAGVVLALLSSPTSWFFMGFELVNILAGAMLVLIGLGRFRNGLALALLCVAGAVGAGSALGHVGAAGAVYGIRLMPLTAGKGLIAGVLVLIAAAYVLLQDRSRTFPLLLKGVLWALPLVVMIVLWRLGIIQNLMAKIQTANVAFGVMAWLTLLIVVVILICGAGHYFINAFIAGTAAGDEIAKKAEGTSLSTPSASSPSASSPPAPAVDAPAPSA
jgi:hypothetical protein